MYFIVPLVNIIIRLSMLLRALFVGLGRQLVAVKTYLIAMLFIGGMNFLAAMTKKLFIALGIGFVTYQLGSLGLDTIYENLSGYLSDLPADALSFLKLARVDEAISVIFGALSARLTLMGFALAERRKGTVFYA